MIPATLSIDFETKSAADLKKVGLHNYASHPTTDALCIAYAIGDSLVDLLIPEDFIFAPFLDHVRKGGKVSAQNVAFELAIWNNVMTRKYGWPPLSVEQCECTMVKAYAMALPGALENSAPAAGLKHEKDMKGHRLMLQLSQPREIVENKSGDTEIIWWDDEEKLSKLYNYCKQDVVVERELSKRLVSLTPYETKLWQLDQKINNRGICVDIDSVKKAIDVVKLEQKRLNERMQKITFGAVATCTAVGQLSDFLKWNNFPVESVDKSSVIELLKRKDLPAQCREPLILRQEAGKSSTAKLESMLHATSSDGRLRGMFQFTAATTRRWAGRRVQLHNLPRPKISQKDIEGVFNTLWHLPVESARSHINVVYGPPLSVISDCLRGFLTAKPGHELIGGDFSNVEGRVLAWLAGEEWKLDAFRKYDKKELPDIYVQTYSRSFHVPLNEVSEEQRQIGKVQELALGFGGGKGAFQQMAKGYGVTVSEEKAEALKTAWREIHPATTQFWHDLNRAAISAIYNHGQVFKAGSHLHENRKISYKVSGSFLWCRLPSGGVLCYPYPKIYKQVWAGLSDGKKVTQKTFHGETPQDAVVSAQLYAKENGLIIKDISQPSDCISFMSWIETTKKWERILTYGGSLAENVTQATSRDLLADAMLRIDSPATPIVLHVHDEINAEVKIGSITTAEFEKLMTELPVWAKDLPLAAKASIRKRYGK